MTSKTLDVEGYMRREEELSRIVTVDETHIVIHIPGDHIDGDYEISLSSCKTAEQIVSWIFHLTGKQWVDRDILRRFIKVASHHAGITL